MVKEQHFTLKGFVVWGVCSLFFMYEFFLRTVTGTYQQSIMEDLHLTTFQFSFISTTLFFAVYGMMQLPVGLIVNKIGLKKALLMAMVSCGIGAIGFSYAGGFWFALIYRMIMGFGASFGFICVLVSIHQWMPVRFNAVFIGISQFIGTLGPMVAAGPVDALTTALGLSWRGIFFGLFLAAVLMVVLVLFVVENKTYEEGQYRVLHRPLPTIVLFRALIKRIRPWYIAIFSAFIYFPIEYLSGNEGRAFLSLKGFNFTYASFMLTVAWLGYALANPLVGAISDIMKRRLPMMRITAFLGVITLSGILYGQSEIFLFLCFFGLGISASGITIGYATIAEQFQSRFVPIAFGLNNAVITFFVALNAPLIAFVLDCSLQGGCEVKVENYLTAFSILIGAVVVAWILATFFMKETFCKSTQEYTYLYAR